MKKRIALLTLCCSLLPALTKARPDHPLEKQLVTIRVTYQAWNEYRPWQKSQPRTRTFLGTVLPNHRILVLSRHLIDANLIQVEKYDRPPRVSARILHCDYQVGLALLTVDEPGFFDDLTPVNLAPNASGTEFYCAAWKSSQLALASCRWSRVSVLNNSIPYLCYASIYFITDLKNGGRGEPVFNQHQMIGLAKSQSNDRISVIPVELIQAYLKATEQPSYPGFAFLGVSGQSNRGHAQSAFFGLKGKPRGIRVCSTQLGSSADGVLQPDDIILKLDGHPIDSQGDYAHPRYGMINYQYIATENHYAGDTIQAEVLRNKEMITLEIPLKRLPPSADRIPKARIEDPPPYLVAGGLVFRELDVPYLKAWGTEWKNRIPAYLNILYEMHQTDTDKSNQRLIILADVFPDEYNIGYHDMAQNIVKTVNNQPIHSISDLEAAFQHPEKAFHVIDLERSYGPSKIILSAPDFEAATQRIMHTYQIPQRIRLRK